MATWYAQGANNVNINAAGRWNSAPAGGGTTLTWPPGPADILVANGKITLVNVSTTVATLLNDTTGGATSGGYFSLNTTGVSMTANGYNSAGNGVGIVNVTLTSGTAYFVGNLYAGAVTNSGGCSCSTGSGGTLNVTGNLYGGSGANAYGLFTGSTSTTIVNVTGNAYGGTNANGYGLQVNAAGAVTLTGNAIASANAPGAYFSTNGVSLTITGYVEASTSQSGAISLVQGTFTVGETRSASNGRGAVTGAFRYASTTLAKSLPIVAGTQKTLSVLNVAALVPAEADVRSGAIYGDGAYTGTLAINRKRVTMAGRF